MSNSEEQFFLSTQYLQSLPFLHLQQTPSSKPSGNIILSAGAINPDLHTSSLTGLHAFGEISLPLRFEIKQFLTILQ
jgi:hypothetical protein